MSFVCDTCGEDTPDDLGAADARPDTCDFCWGLLRQRKRRQERIVSAIVYTLDRIQSDPDLHYAAGFGTEVFRRLCEAEAELTGTPMEEVEHRRRKTDFGGKKSRADMYQEMLRDATFGTEAAAESASCDAVPPPPAMPALPCASRVRLKTCSLCQRAGHNARTCAKRKRSAAGLGEDVGGR